MDGTLLDNLTFKPNLDYLIDHLHLKAGSKETEDFKQMAAEAQEIARPKAYYKLCAIDSRGEDHIVVAATQLDSRILQVNTQDLHRVFPFVVTCGTELAEWSQGYSDLLERYYADELKLAALRSAMRKLEKDVKQRYNPGRIAAMEPGSLKDWPIQQQKRLFTILGDTQALVGVELTRSMLMVPDRSVSGIYFQNEKGYTNCQLCPVQKCPSRKAPHDEGMYEREFQAQKS